MDVVIVGGCGHIGLPLGIALAASGYQVALYDLDQEKRHIVAEGRMPFLEYDAEPLLKQVIGKTLHPTGDVSVVGRTERVIVTVGTPVDEYMNPTLTPIFALAEQLAPYLKPQAHVIMRSTVFPRTCERLADYFEQRGLEVHVSFCPERIAQGYAIRELSKLPQLVSGFSPEAIQESERLFQRLGCETIVLEVLEAELAKLFSNAWRYLQFAIANQFYMIAASNGVDFGRIHHAMTHRYGRADLFPTAGFAAGPCLLKDTMQLSAFYQNNFLIGHAAMLVNEGLPAFVISELRKRFDLSRQVIGVLGMAFKADVDDTRDSLSFKLVKLLRFYGSTVLMSDELAQSPDFVSRDELIARSSIVIVAVPHRAYRSLSIPEHVQVVDLWGCLPTPARAGAQS
jgi:UDP-N-acetyl-D-mannosaminuronic acid dehydrogenase